LNRLDDIDDLNAELDRLDKVVKDPKEVKKIIVSELKEISKKYGKDRKTEIVYASDLEDEEDMKEEIPDYPVFLFFTKEGYFKKIQPNSWLKSGEHKLKEGDKVVFEMETTNNTDLLFFTNKNQVYKSNANDFDDTKSSNLGDFVGSHLGMEEGETAIYMAVTKDYSGYMLFFFENGKIAKVDMQSYATKTNRKKLIKAYSDKSPIVDFMYIKEDKDIVLMSTDARYLLVNTGMFLPKTTKDTQGVSVMSLRKGQKLYSVRDYSPGEFAKPYRYKTKNLPAKGMQLSSEDNGEQLQMTLE
ncbi:MAG: topoisomerase IV, partial [Clostridia bacterium]|nr:topoisomerase IV [Clostridia bacterium]